MEFDPEIGQQISTGLEYLLWRIREEICRLAIPEMTKFLDEYFFRLKRNKQESMSAWALREEKVYLQMTRALARLEQTAGSLEPDWDMLYERQQNWSRWNNSSRSWRTNRDHEMYESVVTLPRKHMRGQNLKSMMNTR